MKLTCIAIKIDLYKKKCSHLKAFWHQQNSYMHICASTYRTRDLPETDEMSTDNHANHGNQRKH